MEVIKEVELKVKEENSPIKEINLKLNTSHAIINGNKARHKKANSGNYTWFWTMQTENFDISFSITENK